jgi:hypothetical protein
MQEALFMVGRVIGAASQGEVFTARQTGRDGDERYCWLLHIRWYIHAFDRVASKLLRLSDVVRETLNSQQLYNVGKSMYLQARQA